MLERDYSQDTDTMALSRIHQILSQLGKSLGWQPQTTWKGEECSNNASSGLCNLPVGLAGPPQPQESNCDDYR